MKIKRGGGVMCLVNKPEGREVDRYGLEWNYPGEPYGFDLRGPERRARTPSTKSHAETSRTKSKRVRLGWNVRLH